VANFDLKLKLVHFCDADHLNVCIRMEVAAVGRVPEEVLHLQLQKVDILERCIECAED
jgi:hypothetical protein